jgi:hypothetical protein
MRPGTQRLREIESKVDDLAARINEFPAQFNVTMDDFSGHHYPHMARHIAQLYADYLDDSYQSFSKGDTEQEERDLASVQEAEQRLDLYFELLELFSDYREAEFHTEDGLFPDIRGSYVNGSRDKLRDSLVEKIKQDQQKCGELRAEIIEREERYQREEPSFLGDSMYRHMGGNLIASYGDSISLALELTYYPSLKKAVKWFGIAEPYSGLIETYFELLDKFPEYRKAELTQKDGFFPDLRGDENYVRESEKRLRVNFLK